MEEESGPGKVRFRVSGLEPCKVTEPCQTRSLPAKYLVGC